MGFLYLCFKEALNLIGGGGGILPVRNLSRSTLSIPPISSPPPRTHAYGSFKVLAFLCCCLRYRRKGLDFNLSSGYRGKTVASHQKWRSPHGIHDPIRDPRPYVHCMHCTLNLGVQQMSLACFIRSPSCRHLNQSITTIKVRERGGRWEKQALQQSTHTGICQ